MELAYNSSENFLVSIEEISTTGISITIKDTNEYKREYEFSNDYDIAKKEVDSYKRLEKKSSARKVVNSINIDDNDTIKNTYNWENVYGTLDSGEYKFIISSSSGSIIYIEIYFTIDENGKVTYKEPTCVYF